MLGHRTARLSIRQSLKAALEHHHAGRLQKAHGLYREILARKPEHAEALHYLGVLSKDMGDCERAAELIRRAIAIRPDYAEAHSNLGSALLSIGRIDEAIATLNHAIELDPRLPGAHGNLGSALKAKGQTQLSIAAFRRAIALNPKYAEAYFNLGNALHDIRALGEAITSYRQAITLKPNFAQAYGNLGNVLCENGNVEEGIAAYQKAIDLRPNYAEVHNNLASALKASGRIHEAIAVFTKAIEQKPGWATPCISLGQLFSEQGKFEDAIILFQTAIEREPENAEAHNHLAMGMAELQRFDEATASLNRAAALAPDAALTHKARGIVQLRDGRGSEAVESFRRMVTSAPESVSGWNNLGQALRHVGRFDEARKCFRRALALKPNSAHAYALMANLESSLAADELARLTASFDDPKTPPSDRATLGFVLGKLLDASGRFDEAFAFYDKANALTLQMRHASGARYSSESFVHRVDESIATFTPDFFARVSSWGEASELPVFIVGMPRSGTSLVEQIAASHPDVFGAGELKDISNLATALQPEDWRPEVIKPAAAKHLARLRSIGGSAQRVTDKMPGNVELLGLIATLFPTARVIICRRDARDTCLSCFFQRFNNGNLFSFDLTDCGRHHVHTDRLIAQWLKVLPLPMLEMQYEALVADVEGESRRIIGFLGLPWNAACLDFHKTDRTVQTSSDWQVRQPLYSYSVGRWKHYEKHLSPLFDALDVAKPQLPV